MLEEGEHAGTQHFLLFPQCFLHFQRQLPILEGDFDIFCLQVLEINLDKFEIIVNLYRVYQMQENDFSRLWK